MDRGRTRGEQLVMPYYVSTEEAVSVLKQYAPALARKPKLSC